MHSALAAFQDAGAGGRRSRLAGYATLPPTRPSTVPAQVPDDVLEIALKFAQMTGTLTADDQAALRVAQTRAPLNTK